MKIPIKPLVSTVPTFRDHTPPTHHKSQPASVARAPMAVRLPDTPLARRRYPPQPRRQGAVRLPPSAPTYNRMPLACLASLPLSWHSASLSCSQHPPNPALSPCALRPSILHLWIGIPLVTPAFRRLCALTPSKYPRAVAQAHFKHLNLSIIIHTNATFLKL